MAETRTTKALGAGKGDQPASRLQTRDAGSNQSFTALVERHRGYLMRRCQGRLGNRQDAEDAVQETMLRAYRALGGFRGEAGLVTWLTAIADNQCATLAARRARHVIGEHLRRKIELYEELRQGSPERWRSAGPGVQRMLSRAPRRDREILRLRFFQDLALEEIASTLGIGLSAAKMRLYRALERMQARVRESAAGPVG